MALDSIISAAQEWLWLSVILPVGLGCWLLLKRLLKTYTDGFEEAAGGYFKSSGQATFQRLLSFGFRACYDRQLIHSFRTYEIQGLKTRGPFTLDLEKVFVPLRIAPESAHHIDPDLLRKGKAEQGLSIWDFLSKASKEPSYRRLAVIAAPGAGKTTLLRHLTLVHAQRRQGQYHAQAKSWLPVLLYLRDLSQPISDHPDLDLADAIQTHPVNTPLNPPPGWFKRQLQTNHCLVLLDGLDEVAEITQRKTVAHWVERQMRNYPNACFILTSRPFGYRDTQMEGVGMVLEVQPFNVQQMAQFLDNWYLQNETMRQMRKEDAGIQQAAAIKASDLKQRILQHSALAAMAVNPLLLTMIATVHDNRGALPGRRVELYGEICDVLLGRRQEAKGLADSLTALQKQRVLQTLALGLMETGSRSFTLDVGSRHIADRLARVAGPDADGTEFLRQIENLSGLLVQRELGVYEFVHKSFQEYLAAVEIKDASLSDYLLDKLADPAWEETIRLYAVQTRDASALISAMLDNPTAAGLALANDCLEEGTEVTPELRQALQERVEAGLESADAATFKLAAQVKLTQRLRKLTPLGDGVFIDSSLLTCAEYQLFIDECRQRGEARQPDHWRRKRFGRRMTREPIVGVHAEDAEAFCCWLNQQNPEAGVHYRLPTPKEIAQMQLDEAEVGYWCAQLRWDFSWDRFVVGILPMTIAQTEMRLRQLLADQLSCPETLDMVRTHSIDFEREFARPRSRILARAFVRDFAHSFRLDIDHALDLNLAHTHAFHHDLDRIISLVRIRNLKHSTLTDSLALSSRVLLSLILCLMRKSAGHRIYRLAMLSRKRSNSPIDIEFETRQAAILKLWTFCALINERQQGNLPAWEGIRIVKERTTKI